MITGSDFYQVMCAMVPLYSAMFAAYASVKWCRIFTPEQCSGINRFVSVFAVPVLSFHFISQNNPYEMDTLFILSDTLSKAMVFLPLCLWALLLRGGLNWLITVFSVATLPNTLVMGIPLLKAMYGDFTQSLMVQLIVLQCIIWYTLLLFLFEYRAATVLIRTQFPGAAAASIAKFELEDDVISLDGVDPLRTESETDVNGQIRVRIRRSISSALSSSLCLTPRASNLSNAEIFSVNTPNRPFTGAGTDRTFQLHNDGNEIVICDGDLSAYGFARPASAAGSGVGSPMRLSGYASSDAYSLQPTPPRASNYNEMDTTAIALGSRTPVWMRSPVAGRFCPQPSPVSPSRKMAWDINAMEKEISFRDNHKAPLGLGAVEKEEAAEASGQVMPRAVVMVRLILTVVGRKLSRNPNTYSSVLGLLWSLISFKWKVGMPSIVKFSIKIVSDAGLGMAMFSLGLFMALQPRIIACGRKKAAMGMVIRFICGPMVMSAASILVGLKGPKLHTAIVQAALPQGIVPFVFAREYGLHPDILSTMVIFGMIVSLPVTLLYYILLGL